MNRNRQSTLCLSLYMRKQFNSYFKDTNSLRNGF